MTGPAYAAPLRAVDRVDVTPAGPAMRVSATKEVDPTDPYLPGHFPGQPVFPGVFVLEAVRQAVRAALDPAALDPAALDPAALDPAAEPDLVAVHSLRFLTPAVAGDVLTIDATVPRPTTARAEFEVVARCRRGDGTEVARLRVGFRCGTPPDA